MTCIGLLRKLGVLRPYGVDEILAAERDDVIREHSSAVSEHASSSHEVKTVAIVASISLKLMQDRS